MKFDDAKEKMTVVQKLHTARDIESETIVYKKPYVGKKIIVITNEKNSFDFNKITYMSLSEMGLLIQYKAVNINKMYPFPLNMIKDIIIDM